MPLDADSFSVLHPTLMHPGFKTLCERYIGLLQRAATEGYPVGVRDETAREYALTDWEATAFLPTDDLDMAVTLSHIETARETINDVMERPIRPVHHRDGRETYGWRPNKTNETDETAWDQSTLFEQPAAVT